MPSRRLHLVTDGDLGPALWVREQVGPGRSRALGDLGALAQDAPGPIAAVLAMLPSQLRHRVRIPGPRGAADRRVPAAPLDGRTLTALVDAVRSVIETRFGEETLDRVTDMLGEGTAARMSEDLAAMPDLLTALVLDLEARRLVEARHLRVLALERFGRPVLEWRAPEKDRPRLLHALVDARARAAFAAHVDDAAQPTTSGTDGAADDDPLGVIPALASDAEVRADLPTQRRITLAVDAFLDSGRVGVKLTSTDSDLVVRLFEPPLGTAWPLQTCLREEDGTVHPVAELRAVGDLSAAGAAEASAAVLRLAPSLAGASVDDSGVDWLLTTEEASGFLAHDTPQLEAAGVTVLLPRDWTKQRTTLRPQAIEEDASAQTSPSVGLNAMAGFRWRVAVGEVELSEEEIDEIRAAQVELVQLRGQWVRLDAATLRAAEQFLDAFTDSTRERRGQTGSDRGPAASQPGREVTGAGLPPGPATDPAAQPGTGAEPEAAAPAPAEITGFSTWSSVFSMMLSPKAPDIDFGMSAVYSGGPQGLARLMPGGMGPYPHPQPSSLQATLRPYQVDGLNWLWTLHELGFGGILADDMGLGKTMQVLALLCREREGAGLESLLSDPDPSPDRLPHPLPSPGPTLLVCPMSVVGAWQREAARFAPHLSVHVHHGGDRVRDESFAAGAADLDLVITTYSLLARDLPVLRAVPWHRIVFDEAQHVKTPGTQVTRAARDLEAPHRLVLTGTPVENRLADLHSLMEVANPGLLGSATSFRESIANPVENDGDGAALTRLRFVTAPFVLRRVKTDRSIIAELPEKIELTRVVNLTLEQAGLYEAIVDELMTQIKDTEQDQRRTLVVAAITRLKQVCNHPAHYLGDGSPLQREGLHRSGKLELVDDLLETAFAKGQKALVFTQFTAFGQLLVPYWAERFGIDVPFLHGGVSKRDRDTMVAEFQEHRDGPGLMLLSLRAGGTGLTLTAANHVVHLDRWWNPAVENQATDRAFRIGQRRDVTVHKLVSAGTVEERIDQVLDSKQALAELTISPGEDWLADLDDDSLQDLLGLDEDER